MRLVYINLSKCCPPAKEQERAIRRAGHEDFSQYAPVYTEKPGRKPARDVTALDEAIGRLRQGDELMIATACCLARTVRQAIRAMRLIFAKGASLVDATTGQKLRRMDDQATEYAEAVETEFNARRAALARRERARSGAPLGRKIIFDEDVKKRQAARRLWADPELSQGEVARLTGISVSTLWRHFGCKAEAVAKARRKAEAA